MIAVGALLLAGACTEGPPSPADDGGQPDAGGDAGPGKDAGPASVSDGGLPLGNSCSVFAARRCGYLQRCGLIEGTAQALRDCQGYVSTTSCRKSGWPSRVDAGTLRYDEVIAQACADADLVRGCDQYETEPLPCTQFLSPGSYPSGPCYGGYPECREGVCRGTACPRTCQAPGLADEACSEPGDCRPDAGLFCRFGTTTPGLGKCTAYGGLAAACGIELPCASDLFCNNLGKCEPRHWVAEPCIGGTCVESAWCHYSPSDGGFCASRELAGAACTDDVQCRSGLLCEPLTGTCVTAGPVVDGGACSLRQRCLPPNVCVGGSTTALGTCLAALGLDALCSSSLDCQPQLSCASHDGGSSRTCGQRQPNGGPCEEDRDCRALSRCVNRSCVALPLPGSPCVDGRCLYGTCDLAADGGQQCADLGSPGAACMADIECGSNRCVSGRCLAACGP